VVLTDAQWTLI